MTNALVFEVRSVPRFGGGGRERNTIENAYSQRTFMSAVQDLLHGGSAKSVQLRYFSAARRGSIKIQIRIEAAGGQEAACRLLGNALPRDYRWKGLNLPAAEQVENSPAIPNHLYISRIERRLNFIDLPWRVVDTLEDESEEAGGNEIGLFEPVPRTVLDRRVSEAELQFERMCIPVTGPLEADQRSLRSFLDELRLHAPCVFTIALAAPDAALLDKHRRIATLWGGALEQFGGAIANAGFAAHGNLRAQYDRFLLPDRHLVTATMRVGALSAIDARAVALHAAARLGGLRAFSIREAVRAPVSAIGDPWSDAPHSSLWDEGRWAQRLSRLKREMGAERIECDEIGRPFLDFLSQLPHVYTIDEAGEIASLPVSDEQGLPGIETRLVEPFAEAPPSQDAMQTGQAEVNVGSERIRIGLNGTIEQLLEEKGKADEGVEDWHLIDKKDFTKHALIVGSTGSGKTVATSFILRQLAKAGVPFLVVEPVKTEYFDQLKDERFRGLFQDLRRYNFEGGENGDPGDDFLPFDPMYLQQHVTVSRHASYLKSCFEAAFPLDAASSLILESGIRRYYTFKSPFSCGLSLFDRGGASVHKVGQKRTGETRIVSVPASLSSTLSEPRNGAKPAVVEEFRYVRCFHPSLDGFMAFFLYNFLPDVVRIQSGGGKAAELLENWKQMFERRFEALMSGVIGVAARLSARLFEASPTTYDPFTDLVSGHRIIELDAIPDDEQKALLMAFLMTFLYERRQAEDFVQRQNQSNGHRMKGAELNHVVVIEEAHRLLSASPSSNRGEISGQDSRAKSVSSFVQMLAEIRAYGQGIIIVEQIPTKIVVDAIKNTNLKIMLRLTAADDREYLGSAMAMTADQIEFVTSLRATSEGVSMVVFEQQLDQPRLLSLPYDAL